MYKVLGGQGLKIIITAKIKVSYKILHIKTKFSECVYRSVREINDEVRGHCVCLETPM